ncbi:hypothetical protein, partial [Streptomyces luridiscabiei]|uniref:hypothetical protein n=1 Tax=Streptomyces luridiscabiei TaxID=164114 RepID=UPI001F165C29
MKFSQPSAGARSLGGEHLAQRGASANAERERNHRAQLFATRPTDPSVEKVRNSRAGLCPTMPEINPR